MDRDFGFYLLEGKDPVKCEDMKQWAMEINNQRIVLQTYIGKVFVSTVFLGIDHSYDGSVPILFETMIFRGKHDNYQKRYSTWDEAVKGHEEACELVSIEHTSLFEPLIQFFKNIFKKILCR